MRIAVDVQGTLRGPKSEMIMSALKALHKEGHTIVVWSSLLSYASEMVERFQLPYDFQTKQSVHDMDVPFDVAIDDDRLSADYLGAKAFVFVDEFNTAGELIKKIKVFEKGADK